MGTNYKHLSCEERTMIQLSLEQRCTLRAIARSVQRAPSSISRELREMAGVIRPFRPRSRGARRWRAAIVHRWRSSAPMP